MKIISWNVNGIRASFKKGAFQNILDTEKPDVLTLNETKSTPDQLTEEMKGYGGYTSVFESSSMRKGYSGVAIYSKEKPISVKNGLGVKGFLDNEGRTIVAEFEKYYLINCYFPNGGKSPEHYEYKLEYYKHFLKLAKTLEKKKPLIWCGDVNATNADIDLARPKENAGKLGCTDRERLALSLFTDNFIDTYRYINGDKVQYTWWDMKTRSREKNVGWRIDYFYTSKNLTENIEKAEIMDTVLGSDHCPIMLVIKI
jgi:exodeoxyribonuclease-3